jgi:hypothetical protein
MMLVSAGRNFRNFSQVFGRRAIPLAINFSDDGKHVHFKESHKPHPLNVIASKVEAKKSIYEIDDYVQGDHTGRLQNHIWTKEELHESMTTLYRHKPATISDYVMNSIVSSNYLFNLIEIVIDVWIVSFV